MAVIKAITAVDETYSNITVVCPHCGKERAVKVLTSSIAEVKSDFDFLLGMEEQPPFNINVDVDEVAPMSEYTTSQREALISSICDKCWDAIFMEEETAESLGNEYSY